jgi:hypothetical protein
MTVDELIAHLQMLSNTGKGNYKIEFEGGGALENWDITSDRIDVNERKQIITLEQQW